MIKQLLNLQFLFLFCPGFIISLVIFGSDFNGLSGKLYAVALLIISVLHLTRRWWLSRLLTTWFVRSALSLAVLLGVAGYRQIHLNIWDEHSVLQAILISALAILSYFGSAVATFADQVSQADEKYQLAKALLILSLSWLFALVYPQSVFLVVTLLLGLAVIWLSWSQAINKTESNASMAWRLRYLVFVLVLDGSLVIWDYKVNSLWAGYLAISLLASALGAFLAEYISNRWRPWVFILLGLNFLVAILFPDYILSTLHSFVLGAGFGVNLAWSLQDRQRNEYYQPISNLWPLMLLGMVVSYAFYAHLSLAYWRAVFVIPILYVGIHGVITSRNEAQDR